MEHIVIAPDSFKESLDAIKVAEAIATGVKRVLKHAVIKQIPMSDGGEGLVQTLIAAKGGKIIPHVVKGPMGRPVNAFIGVLNDNTTGIIEMAAASGLAHVPRAERNPLLTTTYGTEILLANAAEQRQVN